MKATFTAIYLSSKTDCDVMQIYCIFSLEITNIFGTLDTSLTTQLLKYNLKLRFWELTLIFGKMYYTFIVNEMRSSLQEFLLLKLLKLFINGLENLF